MQYESGLNLKNLKTSRIKIVLVWLNSLHLKCLITLLIARSKTSFKKQESRTKSQGLLYFRFYKVNYFLSILYSKTTSSYAKYLHIYTTSVKINIKIVHKGELDTSTKVLNSQKRVESQGARYADYRGL